MEDNIQHVQKSTVVLSLAIITLAILVVWQQQQISQIRNAQTGVTSNTNGAQQAPALNQAKAIRDDLLTSKTVSGTVVSANSNEVVVKASLVDLSALDTFDFRKSQTLPAVEKNLAIKITKDTAMSGGKLVAGGIVTIQTKEPVYGSGTLTAVSISVGVPPKAGPSAVK